jgi:hypothetical protein
LALSAFFVPQLRTLHVLQAFLYVAIILLARRDSPWGFGAGVIIATVWNGLNFFITHLFQAGVIPTKKWFPGLSDRRSRAY